ncbi:hypothetical protein MFMK1_000808 [Metallumcola ferriviriculae]|uniref:Uncharacterized protein n=1 Tax=Metallumcola ferriviriculae TaxID=3039180 RepID=A0AAU0UKV6_9FIRM|nr:hypothetical protein MFMK1_000808 [Desulfitibacteraceae bacterium MK1]
MQTIQENFKARSTYSIRLNDKLAEIAQKTGLPLSNVIEICLANFATLNDDEKIQFIAENDPGKINASELKEPTFNYADEAVCKAKDSLGDKASKMSNKILIAIGLALLAAFLFKGEQNE